MNTLIANTLISVCMSFVASYIGLSNAGIPQEVFVSELIHSALKNTPISYAIAFVICMIVPVPQVGMAVAGLFGITQDDGLEFNLCMSAVINTIYTVIMSLILTYLNVIVWGGAPMQAYIPALLETFLPCWIVGFIVSYFWVPTTERIARKICNDPAPEFKPFRVTTGEGVATEPYDARQIEPCIWQITDVLDDRAYLVVGETAAVLVDTCAGYGDIRLAVRELTSLPVTVLLTHYHYDHTGGAYFFDEVGISREDDGRWEHERGLVNKVYAQLFEAGTFLPEVPFGPRDDVQPRVRHVEEGDVFDLGGLTVEAVSLPGHSFGSMGYLVRERRVLLSGDAVTPIMCLFLEDSLAIDGHRATLAKMGGLPFDRLYTGHHAVAFVRDDLASFDEAAAYAQKHHGSGVPWQHALLPEFVGTVYFPPCATSDVNSSEFRSIIGPYVPRATSRKRKK